MQTGCSGSRWGRRLCEGPGWVSEAVQEGFLEEAITVTKLEDGAGVGQAGGGSTLGKGTALRKQVPLRSCSAALTE